jgi:hypothetical protein
MPWSLSETGRELRLGILSYMDDSRQQHLYLVPEFSLAYGYGEFSHLK